MNSRERVIASIEFKGPDRIPHRHAYLPAVFDRYPKIEELYQIFPSDFAGEDGKKPPKNTAYTKGNWKDEWGCVWTVPKDGFLGQVTGHPLNDWKNFKYYRWPDPGEKRLIEERNLASHRDDKYLLLGWFTLFELMIGLRGFENLMTDIGTGSPDLTKLRDGIVNHHSKLINRLLEFNPDCIAFADDWGSQQSLLVNPSFWRETFLPAYKSLFRIVKENGKHVFFHSDGYTIEILPDLVEAGVDLFWVDLTVNGISTLKKRLGGKVCFHGLTDVQFIMKNGTSEEVKNHAVNLISSLGSFNGGFIGCSELAPDQPWGNIETVLKTFFEYGRYPFV
jgi:uroporphyrinogen decarboxylase